MKSQRSPRDHAPKHDSKRQVSLSPASSMDDRTKSMKRKASPDLNPPREDKDLRTKVLTRTVREFGDGQTKKTKERKTDQTDDESASTYTESSSSSSSSSKRTEGAEDGEGPRKKRMSADQDDKTETRQDVAAAARAEFEAKYEQQNQLGEGGCGSVFAGYRRADRLPVAIKRILKDKVFCTHVGNKGQKLSVEVAIMLKIADGTKGAVGTSAPVSLLDWYDLDQELILVLERPVPCKDLLDFIKEKGGSLQEEEAKVIMNQLVAAVKDLKDHRVFHRDIKVENLLIETDSDVPRVRIIDFGLGCFFKKRSFFQVFFGTSAHAPPEWVSRSLYRAGPTTVWQLGVVLFDSLHQQQRFDTEEFIKHKLEFKEKLSPECLDFLQLCLTKDPEQRPTLEDLQKHPWLR